MTKIHCTLTITLQLLECRRAFGNNPIQPLPAWISLVCRIIFQGFPPFLSPPSPANFLSTHNVNSSSLLVQWERVLKWCYIRSVLLQKFTEEFLHFLKGEKKQVRDHCRGKLPLPSVLVLLCSYPQSNTNALDGHFEGELSSGLTLSPRKPEVPKPGREHPCAGWSIQSHRKKGHRTLGVSYWHRLAI